MQVVKVALGTVLLGWGGRHNIPQAGRPKNRSLCSPRSGGRSARSGCWQGWVPRRPTGEGSVPGLSPQLGGGRHPPLLTIVLLYRHILGVSLCVPITPFHGDTSENGLPRSLPLLP